MSSFALLSIIDLLQYWCLQYNQQAVKLGTNHSESDLLRAIVQQTYTVLNQIVVDQGIPPYFGPTALHKYNLTLNLIHFYFNTNPNNPIGQQPMPFPPLTHGTQ